MKAGVIPDEADAGAAAEEFVGAFGDFVHDGAVVPWGVADGVVNGLIVEIRDVFFHAFKVLGLGAGLDESADVGADFRRVGVAAGEEEVTKRFDERHDSPHGSDDVLRDIG